jgi:2'-5' RNA ligase
MRRLFIALPLEDDALVSLGGVHTDIESWGSLLKVVPPENYHLTLKFLGNCDDDLARSIESGFGGLHAGPGEIPFRLRGIGTFPSIKRASVIWCGLDTDREAVQRIYGMIEQFASPFGFKEEKRDFVPHLTLARVRKGRKLSGDIIGYIERNGETVFGESSFRRITLFSSQLTPQGPVYTGLADLDLAG